VKWSKIPHTSEEISGEVWHVRGSLNGGTQKSGIKEKENPPALVRMMLSQIP